jgi:hypothetical protein
MGVVLKNNAVGYLQSAITASDTGIVLTVGTGANFPSLAAGEYFYATISIGSVPVEIIKVTARSGDTLTVVRGQEGTSASNFSAGSVVELRVTAQSVIDSANDRVAYVNVKTYGAIGNGVADDTAAFTAAMAASTAIYVPPGNYKITSTLTVPNNTSLIGAGRGTAKLQKFFDGDMMTLGNYSNLSGLWLDGQGSTLSYTGQGVVINNGNGRQSITSCRITNFLNGACLYFFSQGGTQCSVVDLIASQTNGATGTGNFAIVIQDTGSVESGAFPRKFSHIETNGFCSFSFGSSNNTYVSNSFLADLFYSLNSRATLITNCRIANQAALLIQGNNHTIISSAISPQITIQTTSDNIALQGNSYNNLPIIDNSNNSRNLLDSWRLAYTPALTSGGTAPSLGNGTILASYYRNGATTTVVGQLTIGSTTTLGTGGLKVSLPHAMKNDIDFAGGVVYMNIGGTVYEGFAQIATGTAVVDLLRDTSGSVTAASPGTFGTGDFIRWSLTYPN